MNKLEFQKELVLQAALYILNNYFMEDFSFTSYGNTSESKQYAFEQYRKQIGQDKNLEVALWFLLEGPEGFLKSGEREVSKDQILLNLHPEYIYEEDYEIVLITILDQRIAIYSKNASYYHIIPFEIKEVITTTRVFDFKNMI